MDYTSNSDNMAIARGDRAPEQEVVGDRMSDLKICNRCQYTWFSNVESPVRCPSCGSHCWNKPTSSNQCQICGHTWFPRADGVPLRCPSCKTRSWRGDSGNGRVKMKKAVKISGVSEDVMRRYESGDGCLRISIDTGVPMSSVYEIIKSKVGKAQIRM